MWTAGDLLGWGAVGSAMGSMVLWRCGNTFIREVGSTARCYITAQVEKKRIDKDRK